MAEDKKSFILYADYIDSFEELSDEEAGILAKHIFRYVNDLDPELKDKTLRLVFLPIKKQLKRDLQKWDNIKLRRSEAGRKGGLAKQANARSAKQTLANQAVTVNDTVTVIVTDSVINKIEGYSDLFKNKWLEWIDYKNKHHEFVYKTTQSEEAAIKKISSLGGRVESKMIEIIDESMANGWKGFHQLDKKDEQPTGDQAIRDFLNS